MGLIDDCSQDPYLNRTPHPGERPSALPEPTIAQATQIIRFDSDGFGFQVTNLLQGGSICIRFTPTQSYRR